MQGARPLFFLDYIATGKLEPDVVAGIVEGIAIGCRENGCVLLGGETAEMPGMYADGDYDLGEVPLDGLIAAKTFVTGGSTNFVPEALLTVTSAGTVFFDYDNKL